LTTPHATEEAICQQVFESYRDIAKSIGTTCN